MTVAPPAPAPAVARRLPRTPRWWRDALEAAVVGSLAVVTGLWALAGGIGALGAGPSPALVSVGRITGLLSADLLLVQVLLMARVPAVERSYGQDDLARRHRLVGLASFDLLVVHVLLVTVGEAGVDGRNPFAEAWHLVWTWPGMLLATAGTALLVMVVATSVRIARRRLRYESWHLLHLYAYLGVGLALPHQLWTGTSFAEAPLARVWWWGVWAATAATVVVCRLGLPAWRSWTHRLVVEAVVPEGPGVVSVHLTGRRLDRLPVGAGQFFLWRFLDGPGSSRAHPYSLSAAPDPRRLRITVKDLGDGSGRLATLRRGTRVLVEGPYGRLTSDRRTRSGVLLLAGGVGVTPLRALAEELREQTGTDVVLVHRVRSDAEALFRRELDRLAAAGGLRVVRLTGSRARRPSFLPAAVAATGTDADWLRRTVPDVADRDVFVCGPDDWTTAALTALRGAGVPDAQVHLERFSW